MIARAGERVPQWITWKFKAVPEPCRQGLSGTPPPCSMVTPATVTAAAAIIITAMITITTIMVRGGMIVGRTLA